jgi:hypothetical protein
MEKFRVSQITPDGPGASNFTIGNTPGARMPGAQEQALSCRALSLHVERLIDDGVRIAASGEQGK